MLRYTECRDNFRQAVFVNLALGLADPVERKPAYEACSNRQSDRSTNSQVQLSRDPIATLQ